MTLRNFFFVDVDFIDILLNTMTLRNFFFVDVDFISLPTVISKPKTFLLPFASKTVANISSTQNNSLPQFSPWMGLNIVTASARKLY